VEAHGQTSHLAEGIVAYAAGPCYYQTSLAHFLVKFLVSHTIESKVGFGEASKGSERYNESFCVEINIPLISSSNTFDICMGNVFYF